jgi:histidinol-phosphatase (PHP family)
MVYFNLHTHTRYCDGSGEPEEYVQAALDEGFHTIGFSGHAPVPFENNFAIRNDKKLGEYCKAIRDLQKKYHGRISVLLALELDYIEEISRDFGITREECGLDYTIGSVHLVRNAGNERLWFIDGPKSESYDEGLREVFGGDIKFAVTKYYEQVNRMVLTQKPDIVGHFDKIKMHNKDRYFHEEEHWYRDLVMDTLDVFKKMGVIIEVNTRGIYKKRSQELYPGNWVLKEIFKKGLPITLSSDAHRPEEIAGYYPETLGILKDIGFKSLVFFGEGGWQEQEM